MPSTSHLARFVAASIIFLSTTRAFADDWPQWRGPNRDGISKETGLLKEWPKDGPKLLWQVKDLGGGYATPAVVGGRIYVIASKGVEDEFVKALDAKDGGQVWATRIGKVGNPNQQPSYPAARSTPTVEGSVLYALSSDGDVVCMDLTGAVVWKKSLRTDFGGKVPTWAYAESPLVDGDALIVTPGGAEATIVALNKKSGDVIWKSAVPGGDMAGYASIAIAQTGDIKQYIAYTAGGLVGVDAKTGRFLWRYDRNKGMYGMSIQTPVAADGLVYAGADRVGGGAVRLTADQGTVKAEPAYFDTKLPTAIGGVLLLNGYFYGSNGPSLLCVEFKTGEVKWSNRSIAPVSMCLADGRFYLHGEAGDLALIEATADAYRELGRFTPPDRPARRQAMEKAWVYPVIADGRLYVRDMDCLWCYDIKAR
jgi:outer membrane protein assembly factor BamB